MTLARLSTEARERLKTFAAELAAEEDSLNREFTTCGCGAKRYTNFSEFKLAQDIESLRLKTEGLLEKYS